MRAMRIALVAVASAALLSTAWADRMHSRAPRSPVQPRHVVLTGKVKSLALSSQEPGAEPQAGFYLHTDAGDPQIILVVMPASRFPCYEGAQATLEGDFLPADPPFPPALFAARLLSCDAGEARP